MKRFLKWKLYIFPISAAFLAVVAMLHYYTALPFQYQRKASRINCEYAETAENALLFYGCRVGRD